MAMNDNHIGAYIHCGLCLEEWNKLTGISPAEYQDVSVGYTPLGIQVWCNRHDCNVLHIDFEGQKHYADRTWKK